MATQDNLMENLAHLSQEEKEDIAEALLTITPLGELFDAKEMLQYIQLPKADRKKMLYQTITKLVLEATRADCSLSDYLASYAVEFELVDIAALVSKDLADNYEDAVTTAMKSWLNN